MAFRPLSANTAPSRKVLVSEKTSTLSTSRFTPTTSRQASAVPSRHAPLASTVAKTAAPPPQAESEEELATQADLLAEIYAAEKALKESASKADILRRRVHAQSNSQARLLVDHDTQMATKAAQRRAKQAEHDRLKTEAEQLYQSMCAVLRVEESAAEASAAIRDEASRQRNEAKEQLEGIKESIANRKTSIAHEAQKQEELKRSLADVNAEIAELERKKQEQIAHMGELKAKVGATRQLEVAAQQDLDQRNNVLATIQKDIDALKKLRRQQ